LRIEYAMKRAKFHFLLYGALFLLFAACGGGKQSDVLPTALAPTITTQPFSQTVSLGQTATFYVRATGDGALSYQWKKNGSPISGARFTAYTTPPTTSGDSGAVFSVAITDASDRNVTSTSASLTLKDAVARSQHFVDPVNGTDAGDGSASRPWRSLQDVVARQIETQTWEGSLPFVEGKKLVPVNSGAPVKAGDTVWLRTGDYGALAIQSAYNVAPITLAAEPGSVPRFSKVVVDSAQNWILRGLSVSPSYSANYSTNTIVTVENHSWRGPVSDIVIDEFEIFSVPNESVWTTAADWDTKAASAVNTSGARVLVRNCRIRNIDFGISMSGKDSRVEYNTIDGFCGDGLRGLGDDEVFEYNLVKNRRFVNDNHPDGFQSWSTGPGGVGTGVVKNITLRGNTFIAYENATIPFAGTLQGIGCFDGTYDGWIVENNIVITDHWHGISFYGASNTRIVNNTVLDLNAATQGTPWVAVTAHKNGTPSRNCVIRNNLTTTLNVSADASNAIVVDHNLVIPSNPVGYFVNASLRNLRLAPGSPAIDQGSATQAPLLDADQVPRPKGSAIDVGAYENVP